MKQEIGLQQAHLFKVWVSHIGLIHHSIYSFTVLIILVEDDTLIFRLHPNNSVIRLPICRNPVCIRNNYIYTAMVLKSSFFYLFVQEATIAWTIYTILHVSCILPAFWWRGPRGAQDIDQTVSTLLLLFTALQKCSMHCCGSHVHVSLLAIIKWCRFACRLNICFGNLSSTDAAELGT